LTDEITRVEILVKDKDVGKLHRLLVGLALEAPKSQPVVNAKLGKNGVHANTSGSLCDLFMDYITKNKPTELTPTQIDEFCVSVGRPAKSARYYAIDCGKKAGFLRKTGKGKMVKYIVNLAKAKKA
jgi:hypothetical protein